METLKYLKDKQKSIKTINKITNAMQLVSSAKSKKAIKKLNEYKVYYEKVMSIIYEVNKDIVNLENNYDSNYWIIVMSDLGLVGSYNTLLIKKLKELKKTNDKFLILGTKGSNFVKENRENAEWFSFSDVLSKDGNQLNEIVTRIKTEHFDNNRKINIVYTKYISQVEFEPVVETILPIDIVSITKNNNSNLEGEFAITEFEPNKEELMIELQSIYINSFLVNASREALASENTLRKNAMETATNNGNEMLEKISIKFNRARQAKITQELSEIIGGAESLK